jgi:hypothetical protein
MCGSGWTYGRGILDVWQGKDLQACFSDVWQVKDLELKTAGLLIGVEAAGVRTQFTCFSSCRLDGLYTNGKQSQAK